MTPRDKGALLIGVAMVGISAAAVWFTWTQDHRDAARFRALLVEGDPDAALGRALRQLAIDGQAPMLTYSEHGWYCHLRCGREPVFRETAEEAARDAAEASEP